MREHAGRMQAGKCDAVLQFIADPRVGRDKTDAGHTGIDLKMNVDRYTGTNAFIRQRFGIFPGKYRLGDTVLGQGCGHCRRRVPKNQDILIRSIPAEMYGLFDVRHTQPADAGVRQLPQDIFIAVAVGIRLDDGHQLTAAAELFSKDRNIPTQPVQVDFGPGAVHKGTVQCKYTSSFISPHGNAGICADEIGRMKLLVMKAVLFMWRSTANREKGLL